MHDILTGVCAIFPCSPFPVPSSLFPLPSHPMNDKTPQLYYDEETLQKSTDSEKAFLEIMEQKLDGDWFVFHSVRFTD